MEKKKGQPKVTARQARIITATVLLNKIWLKVSSLKHGYIADMEFAELKKQISKI